MLIEKLSKANAPPNWEDEAREIIKTEIKDYVDSFYTDRLGNLIAQKNGAKPGKHVALSANMDEAGLVVMAIGKSGELKFASWGVDERSLVSQPVKVGANGLHGVIGYKPIHLQEPEEKTKPLKLEQLYVDIGADSKEEAEKYVSIGDFIAFHSPYQEFGDYKLKGKGLEGRLGCAAIIEMLQSGLPYKLTAVFTVQGETGMRGATVAANQLNADVVISLGTMPCADTPGVEERFQSAKLAAGPIIAVMDGGAVFSRQYLKLVRDIAKANDITLQFGVTNQDGSDAEHYHAAHGGTPVIRLAVPGRYLRSPIAVFDRRDYLHLLRLLEKTIIRLNEEKCQ